MRIRKKYLYLLTFVLHFSVFPLCGLFSQDIPDKPVPARLVNDLAGMLSSDEINRLENKLVAFNDSTSTQIAIVTVTTLNGYDKSDFAQRLGEKWGIGRKKLDNGILVLVKPKTPDSRGEVFITQGYGLEGAIPDLAISDIVNREILPAFSSGDYYGGLDNATNILMSLARGEFTAADYGQRAKKSDGKDFPVALFIIGIIFFIAIISKKSGGSNNKNISTGGLPLWLLLSMMGSGRGSHRGSWGGFSGGGGGGGGFGGFGGGSVGGGGAGGRW